MMRRSRTLLVNREYYRHVHLIFLLDNNTVLTGMESLLSNIYIDIGEANILDSRA